VGKLRPQLTYSHLRQLLWPIIQVLPATHGMNLNVTGVERPCSARPSCPSGKPA
jgi:hypothetical protein